MSKFDLFSRLSQGYGTWDGIAKKEAAVENDNEIFSLDDLRLPPIVNRYDNSEKSNINCKKTFQSKPLKFPVVQTQPLHKTYTTRKGALLLYSENYFLPGSPKAKKRRRKLKQQSSVKLKTLIDLRDFILNYKRNGGDPLFLALLQKRLSSGSFGNHVRPGFSPKRYIATLGRSLQEDSWNKLLTSGSFKDPALQSYNPYVPPIHHDGSVCELFPSKPQPYSTMSLPPISPSNSMLGSCFNFYPNGMSTGAASLISLDSEEYAPSSRAISPVESLNERLSEVEPIRPKKDQRYALLDSKQKEQLISRMLVQKTLETVDSDLQTWPASFAKDDTYDSSISSFTGIQNRNNSKGSLKSSSLTSIPRLPPIQSAGARPTTPSEVVIEDKTASVVSRTSFKRLSGGSRVSISSQEMQTSKQSKRSTQRPSDASSALRLSRHSSAAVDDDTRAIVDLGNVEIDLSDESSHWSDALAHVIDNDTGDSHDDEEKKVLDLVKMLEGAGYDNDEIDERSEEDSVEVKDATHQHGVESLYDVLPEEPQAPNDDQVRESEGKSGPGLDDQAIDDGTSEYCEQRETSNNINDRRIEYENDEESERELRKSVDGTEHSRSTSSLSIIDDQGPSPEPPPITFEQLHSEARAVASRVLSRPQSGSTFIEDARTALAMWADRLSTLLDPPSKGARTNSASFNIQRGNKDNSVATSIAPVGRKRKISQSAGSSLAALRQALLISGGEVPGVDSLKNLPPIRIPQGAPASIKRGSGVSRVPTFFEPLKDEDPRSSKASASTGHRSVLTERLSNSDLQMEILNLVSDEDLGFVQDRASTVQDNESGDEDFRDALQAVITDLERNISSGKKHTIVHKESSSPKEVKKKSVKSPPFQVKRPVEEKPPPGLERKSNEVTKGKEKQPAVKTGIPVAKKGGKKSQKKGGKGPKKATEKPKVEKPVKKINNQETVSVEAERSKPVEEGEPVESDDFVTTISPMTNTRPTSESSKHLDELSESSILEKDIKLRSNSSFRSDSEQQQMSAKSPSVQSSNSNVAPVIEQPRLVPKPPEPEEPEVDLEQERKEKERLENELAKKKEKELRAAKRAEERAAAAERRRQEVERKRREKEEAKRRQLEEEARLEKVRQEAEEEMRKRELEMRRKREEREEEKRRKEEEERRKEREEQARIEREKRQREEFERKKQELIAQRKLEEEIRREQEKLEAEIEEANRRAEEERLQAMEESERIVLQEKMRREEEELRRRLEAERKIQEEQRRIQEEQRRRREEAIALLRQKRLQRQLFITGLIKEGIYMSLSQRLSRAFTFSYFDKLPWGFLNNLRSMSPIKELINELKQNQIPPTIYEIDEEEENIV